MINFKIIQQKLDQIERGEVAVNDKEKELDVLVSLAKTHQELRLILQFGMSQDGYYHEQKNKLFHQIKNG